MNLAVIPNAICVFRILLVYPTVYFIFSQQYLYAFIVFLVAGISDLFDGWLARRFNWQSKLGGWLDPIADKFLVDSVFLALWLTDLVPFWLLVCVVARDLMIVAGVLYYHFRIEKLIASPSMASKINTVMQLVLVNLILLGLVLTETGLGHIPAIVIHVMMWIVLVLTVFSGISYMVDGIRRAWFVRQADKSG